MLDLSLAVGFIVAEQKVFPYEYVIKANHVLLSKFRNFERKRIGTKSVRHISTVFIRLNMRRVEVPVTIRGAGGGLASFGKEFLLGNYRGEIFAVNGETPTKTKVITPDNDLDAYIEASSTEKYKNYRFRAERLRNNDMLYYSEADEHGLVLSFTEYQPDRGCYNTTLAHLRLPHGIDSLLNVNATADDWRIVFRTKPCLPLKRQ